MREIALAQSAPSDSAPADPALADLVAEIEATGETILLTRNGQPAATLAPAGNALRPKSNTALGDLLLAHLDHLAHRDPHTLTPLTWEALKADIDAEDRA